MRRLIRIANHIDSLVNIDVTSKSNEELEAIAGRLSQKMRDRIRALSNEELKRAIQTGRIDD